MSGAPADKAALRKTALAARAVAHAADRGEASSMLSSVLAGYRGVPLAGYLPIKTEIDPRPAMAEAAAHGPVAVPVIEGPARPLRFSRWSPDGPLRTGPFGVEIPQEDDFVVPQIVIAPLVAFDSSGARLGYGGGYYDRTLAALRAGGGPVLAIGFAYSAQALPALPQEPTDQPLDMIVTERAVLPL